MFTRRPSSNPTTRRGGGRALAVSAVALLAVACGTDDAETASTTEPATSEDTDDAAEDVPRDEDATEDDEAAATDDEAPDASEASTPDEPIATVEGSPPFPLLEIFDLRRDGEAVTLEFAITTDETIEDPDMPIGPRGMTDRSEGVFSAPEDHVPPASQRTMPKEAHEVRARSVSGATLIDRDNANRHLVLRDGLGACLCSGFPGAFAQDTRYRHSVQFPAPPEEVTAMTVEVPRFPSVDDVAISEVGR